MKIKVEYTEEVTDMQRADLATHLGRWPSRDDIKVFMKQDGVSAFTDIVGMAKRCSVQQLVDLGVPAEIIVEVHST